MNLTDRRVSWTDSDGSLWVDVPILHLLEYADPFHHPPWGCEPFTPTDVRVMVAAGEASPYRYGTTASRLCTDSYHVARVAWFVTHPELLDPDSEDPEPPELDVGISSMGYRPAWIVVSGNHRLAAAVALGRPRMAFVVSGCLEDAETMFGITIPR